MSTKQCVAAWGIYHDVVKGYGTSKGLVTVYDERVDMSMKKYGFDINVSANTAQARFIELVHHLHEHERRWIEIIVMEYHQRNRIDFDLKAIGNRVSGYRSGDQARASGTTTIQCFLNSVAEYYGIKDVEE